MKLIGIVHADSFIDSALGGRTFIIESVSIFSRHIIGASLIYILTRDQESGFL